MKKMKKGMLLSLLLLIILINTHAIGAEIISPKQGEIIASRASFRVVVEIPDYDSKAHYWVAIATVKNYAGTRDQFLSILKSKTRQEKTAREELVKLFENWKISEFWPKYIVNNGSDWDDIYDGWRNPRREPQPMILLLLKVSDALDQRFDNWLADCQEDKGCKGIPGVLLKDSMIVSRSEIFFHE